MLNRITIYITALVALICCGSNVLCKTITTEASAWPQRYSTYRLGADDLINIQAIDVPEISEKPIRIEPNGVISLPMIGQMRIGGLTVAEAESRVENELRRYVLRPQVSIAIAEFGSEPISVIGAVVNAGVQQLRGTRTLAEILSAAGGIRPDAGNTIKITRKAVYGIIPLPNAVIDPSGKFSLASIPSSSLTRGMGPQQNITMCPYDVVSVEPADLVYVVGDVNKAGGFPLNDRQSISVLQALSLAGGINPTAKASHARLLEVTSSGARTEKTINIKKVLNGSEPDFSMGPNDILFVPRSNAKAVSFRALQAAAQAGANVPLRY